MEPDASSFSVFDLMVWAGAALTLIGLVMLIWCILRVARARKSATDDDALRESLQKIVPLNLGALFLSAIGLMCVVIGVVLS